MRGSLEHHRWFRNQFSPFSPVLHCPLGPAELQACPFPNVVFPPLPLSALSSSPPTLHCALQDCFGQTWWTGDMTIPLQFAYLYDGQEVCRVYHCAWHPFSFLFFNFFPFFFFNTFLNTLSTLFLSVTLRLKVPSVFFELHNTFKLHVTHHWKHFLIISLEKKSDNKLFVTIRLKYICMAQ